MVTQENSNELKRTQINLRGLKKSLENSKIHMQGNLNERKTFQKNPKEQVTIED